MISQRIRTKRKASGEAACKPERMPQEPVLIACVVRAASARQSPQRERERGEPTFSPSPFASLRCAARSLSCFTQVTIALDRSGPCATPVASAVYELTLNGAHAHTNPRSPSFRRRLVRNQKKAKFGGFFLSLSRGEPRLTSSREHHHRVLRDSIDRKLEQKSTEVRPIR